MEVEFEVSGKVMFFMFVIPMAILTLSFIIESIRDIIGKNQEDKIKKLLKRKRVGDNINGVIEDCKFSRYIRIEYPFMTCRILHAKARVGYNIVDILDVEHIGPGFSEDQNVSLRWVRIGTPVKIYMCEDGTYRIDTKDVPESRAVSNIVSMGGFGMLQGYGGGYGGSEDQYF